MSKIQLRDNPAVAEPRFSLIEVKCKTVIKPIKSTKIFQIQTNIFNFRLSNLSILIGWNFFYIQPLTGVQRYLSLEIQS